MLKMIKTVEVGPFHVADVGRAALVDQIVRLAVTEARERVVNVFALHVGGLNHRHDPDFVVAMRTADLVYADGGSVVWLARRAGARQIERASTTDVGWDILSGVTGRRGRPPRVALVGGAPGLARTAAAALAEAGVADPVLIQHGYHSDWDSHIQRLRQAAPDIVVVGMGAPGEMIWAQRWCRSLPAGLVLTCGGWFGFLAGAERRAPALIRRPGLEWIGRLAQSPTRLGPRYVKGALSTVALARTQRSSLGT